MTTVGRDREPQNGRKKPVRARIRRLYVPNALYFITCVTENRRPLFSTSDHIRLLRRTTRRVKGIHPFQMRAYVFLSDHFHLLLRIGEESDISSVLQSIKRNFTLNYKEIKGIKESLKLWQRGFWDHVIRNEKDYVNHVDYIHYNPVKHGLVTRSAKYPHSSFRHYVELGWYDEDWGNTAPEDIRDWDFE